MIKFKEALKDICINKLKGKKQRTTEWITLPCPFCGDSSSNNNHFNIRISDDDDVIYMMCFQPECDVDRFPDARDFITLGLTDVDLIAEYTSAAISSNIKRVKIHLDGLEYPGPDKRNTKVSEYISKRTHLHESEFYRLKIIDNVREFLNLNGDKFDVGVKEYILGYYGDDIDNTVGFLNASNSKLQIRNIRRKDYKPFTLCSSKTKFAFLDEHEEYSYVHGEFDLLNTPVIVIGEGNFDRINAVKIVNRDGMYVAGLNAKGIFRVLKKLTLLYHYVDIIILSDDDVPLSLYRSFVKKYRYRLTSFSVWYNTASKDFGEMSEVDENKIIKHILV